MSSLMLQVPNQFRLVWAALVLFKLTPLKTHRPLNNAINSHLRSHQCNATNYIKKTLQLDNGSYVATAPLFPRKQWENFLFISIKFHHPLENVLIHSDDRRPWHIWVSLPYPKEFTHLVLLQGEKHHHTYTAIRVASFHSHTSDWCDAAAVHEFKFTGIGPNLIITIEFHDAPHTSERAVSAHTSWTGVDGDVCGKKSNDRRHMCRCWRKLARDRELNFHFPVFFWTVCLDKNYKNSRLYVALHCCCCTSATSKHHRHQRQHQTNTRWRDGDERPADTELEKWELEQARGRN